MHTQSGTRRAKTRRRPNSRRCGFCTCATPRAISANACPYAGMSSIRTPTACFCRWASSSAGARTHAPPIGAYLESDRRWMCGALQMLTARPLLLLALALLLPGPCRPHTTPAPWPRPAMPRTLPSLESPPSQPRAKRWQASPRPHPHRPSRPHLTPSPCSQPARSSSHPRPHITPWRTSCAPACSSCGRSVRKLETFMLTPCIRTRCWTNWCGRGPARCRRWSSWGSISHTLTSLARSSFSACMTC